MTNEEKAKRFIELTKKQQAGTITPAEVGELKALLSGAPEMQPGYIPPKTPAQVQAEFDAMRAKAAADETAKRSSVVVTPTGIQVKPSVVVKPEDIQVNPALIDILHSLQPPAPASAATVTPPKATPEQPIPATVTPPKATPSAPKIDAGAQALVAENPQPEETPDEQAERAERLAKAAKDPSFQQKLDTVSKNWGLSLLEALQAGMLGYIGGATGNWQKSAYQLRMEKEERAAATEAEKQARTEEIRAQDERLQAQLKATAEQADLNRAAESIAQDKQLSMQEKIARLQTYQRSHGLPVSRDAAAVDYLAGLQ